MLSIGIKQSLAACLLAFASAAACAGPNTKPPRYLLDPVLGLRLPAGPVKLDELPEPVRALCEQIADNPTWTARQWLFGTAQHGRTTYYLVGGYFKRRHAAHGEPLYVEPEQGGVYAVSGTHCGGDPAREVFDVRDDAQIPAGVLQRLAHDLASRLVRAFGSAGRLRAALGKQDIDIAQLTPELQEAFKPYLKDAGK